MVLLNLDSRFEFLFSDWMVMNCVYGGNNNPVLGESLVSKLGSHAYSSMATSKQVKNRVKFYWYVS